MTADRDVDANRLAARSLAEGDPTGWFERLYAEAATGAAIVPWERDAPNPLLADWTARRGLDGTDKRALVVGCGYGVDAEHVASLGFRTTAFDISETAIRGARERFPASAVDYVVADLLDPPAEWAEQFDLVVESITVQSMPLGVRDRAITGVAQMVAPGGELLVIAGIHDGGEHADNPPWPLTREELESFAVGGLRLEHVERVAEAHRWRAVFRRA
ncbi:class I SAM-dependent methyltransferase [Saccharothrix coeruleofusca]|nr:class I SAM-dependent methyltransferase [Saccharothrix coeruleofusca]